MDELKGKYLQKNPAIAIGVFTTEEYNYSRLGNTFRLFFSAHSIDMGGAYIYDSGSSERFWYYDD